MQECVKTKYENNTSNITVSHIIRRVNANKDYEAIGLFLQNTKDIYADNQKLPVNCYELEEIKLIELPNWIEK